MLECRQFRKNWIETGNVDSVMDGGIDLFINAYLKWITLGESSGDAGDMPD